MERSLRHGMCAKGSLHTCCCWMAVLLLGHCCRLQHHRTTMRNADKTNGEKTQESFYEDTKVIKLAPVDLACYFILLPLNTLHQQHSLTFLDLGQICPMAFLGIPSPSTKKLVNFKVRYPWVQLQSQATEEAKFKLLRKSNHNWIKISWDHFHKVKSTLHSRNVSCAIMLFSI